LKQPNLIIWRNAGLLLLITTACSCTTPDMRYRQSNLEYQQAQDMVRAGQREDGMARIRTLAEQNPDRPEYRAYLRHQTDIEANRMLKEAELRIQQKRWSDAEILYRQVLDLDEQNQRAKEGMRNLAVHFRHEQMLKEAEAQLIEQDADQALRTIRAVLAEAPGNKAAQALYEELEQKRIGKITQVPRIKSAFKKPITLEFKNVPVKSVFEFIARAANINFTYDREIGTEQRVSVFVRDTSIEDAIQVILTTNQLEKKILNDNTILIYPVSRSAEYEELYVRSFYLGNMDAKRAMALIKTVLKAKDVYIDEKLNTLVMRDTSEAIRNAERLIASQDLAEPEVMLEVEVMEINRRSLEAIGIRYPTSVGVGVRGGAPTVNGVTGAPVSGQLSLAELKSFSSDLGVFTITDPVLALNLLNQDTDTNLLANPHIRVKNREKAKIHVGDRIPVLTSIANATGFVSQSVTYIEVGLKLDVEPTIMLNDEVAIKVGLEVSNQTDQIRTTSGTLTYTIGTRNANTTLRLKDGETQVLAGLFRDDEQRIKNRVPLLGKLPLVGNLFTDRNDDKRKKEIVLLITPRILSNIAPQNAVYTTFPSGLDTARNATNNRGGRQSVAMPATPTDTPQMTELPQERTERTDKPQNDPSQMRPMNEITNSGYGTGTM
jgi:general secretion pathway protein D